jgi:hypothetical protein
VVRGSNNPTNGVEEGRGMRELHGPDTYMVDPAPEMIEVL